LPFPRGSGIFLKEGGPHSTFLFLDVPGESPAGTRLKKAGKTFQDDGEPRLPASQSDETPKLEEVRLSFLTALGIFAALPAGATDEPVRFHSDGASVGARARAPDAR
jgi:hypothetical protein